VAAIAEELAPAPEVAIRSMSGMTAEERLKQMGLEVPEAPKAVGAYVTWVRTGNLVVTSGQLPWQNGRMRFPGRLGEEVDTQNGYEAARLAGLNAIAQLKAATGDLEKVKRILRLEGNVHCGENFREHPRVLDGASELLVAVFGDRGLHTRTAIGVRDMPLNACVQLSVWAEVE
jgi:enamine deaminase RidA (YjgF/YER057c/UK114 family)